MGVRGRLSPPTGPGAGPLRGFRGGAPVCLPACLSASPFFRFKYHHEKERVMGLTNRKKRFVEEYLVDMNGAEAAKRAGYSEKGASRAAYRLLHEPAVQTALEAARAGVSARTGVDADYVVRSLVEIVERSMQRVPVLTARGEQMVDEEGRGVWRFDARSANKALELLGRHLGMFTDRIEADVRESVKVVLFGGE